MSGTYELDTHIHLSQVDYYIKDSLLARQKLSSVVKGFYGKSDHRNMRKDVLWQCLLPIDSDFDPITRPRPIILNMNTNRLYTLSVRSSVPSKYDLRSSSQATPWAQNTTRFFSQLRVWP